jgi:hypothetical protein
MTKKKLARMLASLYLVGLFAIPIYFWGLIFLLYFGVALVGVVIMAGFFWSITNV